MTVRSIRPIRSFVRREGRITKGQRNALENYWSVYGIDIEPGKKLDLESAFGHKAPVWLEIGFGNGEALIAIAQRHPHLNILGIEVHRPGVGHLLNRISELALNNVRVICEDATIVLKHNLPNRSLERILLLFPDPWPKKKHHKRRIVQPEFIRLLAEKLRLGGILHFATDWEDYAYHILEVMNKFPEFQNLSKNKTFAERPEYRALTKFEQRGLRLGHSIWDLIYKR